MELSRVSTETESRPRGAIAQKSGVGIVRIALSCAGRLPRLRGRPPGRVRQPKIKEGLAPPGLDRERVLHDRARAGRRLVQPAHAPSVKLDPDSRTRLSVGFVTTHHGTDDPSVISLTSTTVARHTSAAWVCICSTHFRRSR